MKKSIKKSLSWIGIFFLGLIAINNIINGVPYLWALQDNYSVGYIFGAGVTVALCVWGIIVLGRKIK